MEKGAKLKGKVKEMFYIFFHFFLLFDFDGFLWYKKFKNMSINMIKVTPN